VVSAGSTDSWPVWQGDRVFVTNHVLAGVLIGQRFPRRPWAAFLAGCGSHLVMDAVPHWGCDVSVAGGPERFLRAARRDGVLGLAVMSAAVVAVEPERRSATLAAMAGAVLLDLDKPMEHFFGAHPFPVVVQWFHGWIQRESPAGIRTELAAGAALALADTMAMLRTGRTDADGRRAPVRPVSAHRP
jgi:hypothetical protein